MGNAKKLLMLITLCFALALSSASCTSTQKQSGFLNGYYEKLELGPVTGVKMRWVKPDVDFSKYNKVMIDRISFFYSPDSEYKGIDPELMQKLSDDFNNELVGALKDKYPIVSQPGPDVLRIRIALTGIKQSRPVLSGVASFLVAPVNLVEKGASGAWSGSGATAMEMMAMDSASSEVIAAAQDEQTAEFMDRFSKYGSANTAFNFWAKRLRTVLDMAHKK